MRVPAVLIASTVAAMITAEAHAQDRSSFVTVTAGATFNGATAPLVQVAAGSSIGPAVQLVGEIIYMRDVMPTSVHSRIEDAGRSFESFARFALGQTFTVNSEAAGRTLSGAVGIRLNPWKARVRPFVQVDMGFARVDPRIKFLADGQDISGAVAPPIGGVETKPALGFGGGLDVALQGRLTAEARYKYTRVFAEDAFAPFVAGGFNVTALSFGIGYKF